MSKTALYILSIVSAILSIIYSVLTYYGVTRFLRLKYGDKSLQKHLENYKNIPKFSDNRVVVAFTTTPKRIHRIIPMIKSLLDQTARVDQILMVIPYKYQGQKYEIPEELKKVVTVVPLGCKYKNNSALVGALLREKDANTVVIALRDDIIYGADFIEQMTENIENNDGKISVLQKDNGTKILGVRCGALSPDAITDEEPNYDDLWFENKTAGKQEVHYGELFGYL